MFNNVTKVTANNFNLVWRMIFYKLIAFIVCIGLFLATVVPLINPVLSHIKTATPDFLSNVSQLFTQLLTGGYFITGFAETYLAPLQSDMGEIGNILAQHALNMSFAYIAAIIILLVLRFLFSFTDYAVGYSVHENMSANAKIGFAAAVAKTARTAFKFWFVYTLITLPYDIIMGGIVIAMLYYMPFHVLTMFLVILTSCLLYALRMTLFSFWMPEVIINNKPILQSLKTGVGIIFKNFWNHFGGYIMLTISIIALSIFLVTYTFGAGLLLLFPLTTLLTVVYVFISYYTSTYKSYYTSYDTVVNPPPDFNEEAQNYTIPEEEIQARLRELEKEREDIEKNQ